MRNNPMTGVKQAVAFILGATCASCWITTIQYWHINSPWLAVPIVGAVVSSVLAGIATTNFFQKHW